MCALETLMYAGIFCFLLQWPKSLAWRRISLAPLARL